MTLLTTDEQRYAAVRQRIEQRLKQLRELAKLYQSPGLPSLDNPASGMVISFALREYEVLAEMAGIEMEAAGG